MSVITIFSGTYCRQDEIVSRVLERTGFEAVPENDIVARAAELAGLRAEKIVRAFWARASVFNCFTHEKERAVAALRLAVAERLCADRLLMTGFAVMLIPHQIRHVLRVCLVAERRARLAWCVEQEDISDARASGKLQRDDEDRAAWVAYLLGKPDPWDPALYDIIIPTDKTGLDEAAALIAENALGEAVACTEESRQAVRDFALASRVEAHLCGRGHCVSVSAEDGRVTLTINQHVLRLGRLERELEKLAREVPGVEAVETRVGKNFYQADIYRRYDFKKPSKVLLVDDEREFVKTLSERLNMRDMGSAVVYDGESALELIRRDEPEVMVLDLKMPGVDGIEVLRRVKAERSGIEVIILTGHGSEEDRRICMEMGAFAYLQKPVDIAKLCETLEKAQQKVQRNRQDGA